MVNKKELLTRIGTFLLITIGSFLLVYLPLFCTGKTFIWGVDGISQHYTFLKYLSSHSLQEVLGGIDLVGAVGTDTLINYLYYGLFDPFYLIAHILPNSWIIASYEIIVISKFLATALFMYLYLRYKKITHLTATIFSTAYMLSGYALVMFARHPMLASGMMYLPLLIWGVEKCFAKQRPYLLVITNVVLLLSNFYLFYMCTLFVLVYVLCYVKGQGKKIFEKESIQNYFKIGFCYILTALLCAVVLLPMIYGFLTSARGSNKGFAFPTINTYLQLLLGLFAPINAQNFYVVGISFVVLLLMLFTIFKGKNKTYQLLSIVMLCSLVIPFVGYIMNAFNYVSGRYFFLFVFTAITSSALALEEWKDKIVEYNVVIKVCKAFGLVVIAIATLGCMVLLANVLREGKVGNGWQIGIYIFIIAIGILVGYLFAISKIKINNLPKFITPKRVQVAVLCMCLVVGFGYNIYYAKQFSTVGKVYEATSSTAEKYVGNIDNDSFFRVDKGQKKSKEYFANYENNGLINNYASTFQYNTVSNGQVFNWLKSIGQAGYTHTLGMGGLQGRLAPNAILSTQYYLTSTFAPFGYEKVEGIETEDVYKNEYALPFGFVYQHAMSEKEYNALPIEERANAMLQACIVQNSEENFIPQSRALKLETDLHLTNVELQNQHISAQDHAEITLTFPTDEYAEYILVFNNFKKDNSKDTLDKKVVNTKTTQIKISSDDNQMLQNLYDKGTQMYHGLVDFVFPLGQQKNGGSVSISLTQGEYSFDDMTIFAYNKEDYKNDIAQFDEYLTDVVMTNKQIKGKITTNGGMLFLSLPYSKGWTAYVDGKVVELDRCNIGFMGVKLSEGVHEIKLTYHTPYLNIGTWITIVAILSSLMMVAICESYKSIQRKRSKHEKTI